MFCTNCGSKLPEGSKFCSECGAKLAQAEPAVAEAVTPAAVNISWNEPEEKTEQAAVRRHTVAFDWSNVKEESHKKVVPEVHSPWGTTGLSEKELFAESGDTQDDHSRTMSFIDILKKERDAKAQEAEEAARPVTEKEEPSIDYTMFQEAPSFYVPPLYDDVNAPVTTPYDEQKHAAGISLEEPVAKPEFSFEDEMADEEDVEQSLDISDYDFNEAEDEAAEKYHTASFNEPDIKATEDLSDLEASLAAILDAGAGRAISEDKVDLFEEKAAPQPSEYVADEPVSDLSLEDMYLSMEDPAEPVAAPVFEEPVVDEPVAEIELPVAEPVFEEPVVDAPVAEIDIPAAEPVAAPVAEPVAETPVVEIPAAEPVSVVEEQPAAEPETVEDEIEQLKRRLAELMGTSEAAEEAPEEVAPKDELSLDDLIATPVGETVSFEAAAEPEVELPAAEPELVAEVELPTAEPEAVEEVELPVAEPEVELPAVEPVAEIELPAAEPEEELPAEEPVADIELPSEDIFNVELRDEEPEELEETSIADAVQEAAAEEAVVEPVVAEEAPVEPASDAISLDQLERDLFGETTAEEIEQEETKKIDKFYTLYKKNEEFQKLLDEEYNKLQGEEQVPHVDDFVAEKAVEPETVEPAPQPVAVQQPVFREAPVAMQQPAAQEAPVARQAESVAAPVAAPVAAAPQEVVESKPSKAELKAAKKAAKAAAKAAAMDDDDEEEGGSKVLTVLAIIIAVILVILLGVIVILNFFPDSAIGIKIDSIVSTTTSYFSAVGGGHKLL